MDEMTVWFEVVRAILPQRYSVRLSWERRALVVTSPNGERVAWVAERELATLSPTRVIRLIEAKLQRPANRMVALLDPRAAI
jgi:hypothetical protein